MVEIGHHRNLCKVTMTKKNHLGFDLGKINRAFHDATRARENKRQGEEQDTKSGGRAITGGIVNQYS